VNEKIEPASIKKQADIQMSVAVKFSSPCLTHKKEGSMIRRRYTCDGKDLQPTFKWKVLQSTQDIQSTKGDIKSFALIVDDPDAIPFTPDNSIFTHYAVINIPASAREWKPDGSESKVTDANAATLVLRNDFGNYGWNGPCPPPGDAHHYRFALYALASLILPKETGRAAGIDISTKLTQEIFEKEYRRLILGKGEFTAPYKRRA
jgi:Raf kinase inhibitor-like YbhB/YbcL family protein